jgi:hypothetical protein
VRSYLEQQQEKTMSKQPAKKSAATPKGHYTFTLGPPITPKPPNGDTFTDPDANACVETWAAKEIAAQIAAWAGNDVHKKQYVAFFVKTVLKVSPLDQVSGIERRYALNATQAAALQHGTANTRFIGVSSKGNAQPMPALDANNQPVKGAQAWQGPNAEGVPNVDIDILLQAYAEAFQYYLNKGADGSHSGTGTGAS